MVYSNLRTRVWRLEELVMFGRELEEAQKLKIELHLSKYHL
jgi:hypothetical protein